MTDSHSLTVVFVWDQAAGLFKATLPSGASFAVERRHVSGKLENALELYRRGVVNFLEPKTRPRQAFDIPYDESRVQVVGVVKREIPPLDLDDLGL